MMTEREKTEEKYRPNRRLQYFAATVMRGKQPPLSKQQAIARYAARLEDEEKAVVAARSVMDTRGITRPGFRRLADTLARACGACRRMSEREMVEFLSGKAAMRLGHGMAEELVFEVLDRCLHATGNERALLVMDQVRAEAGRQHAERKAATPAEPKPELAVPGPALPAGIAEELEKSDAAEEAQRQHALDTLKVALKRLKPGLRHVVVDRIARRRTLAEIAAENGLSLDQLRQLLEQARVLVRKYTTYYDDDSFWYGERAQTA